MSEQCPATTRYAPAGGEGTVGLQCKFARGHDRDHCANPGVFGISDIFWPQDEADVIVRADGEDEADHIRKMAAAAMANPGQFVYGE